MREIKKILFGLSIFALFLIPLKVEASSDNVVIVDDAGLLSSSEEEELYDYLSSLNDEINYCAVTSDTWDYYNADSTLEAYYESYYSSYDDGVAFIIDMAHREVYIQGYGDVKKQMRSDDCTDITDNIYKYASKEEYFDCIKNAFIQADTIVNKGFILRPMRFIVAFLVSIIIGFFLVFFKAMKERSKFETIGDTAATIVTIGAPIVGTAMVYDTIKRHRDHSSSSGGHGGHGGGFGGGGHGGGHSGGGHSF